MCRRLSGRLPKCPSLFPSTESNSRMWSSAGCGGTGRGLQGFLTRTGLNSTLWSRPSKLLPFHSLRRSLRCLSLRREKRKTRQDANAHVQHVVNTVGVEIPQFGAETDEDQFAMVNCLITCSISRLQAEAPSDASRTSYRDEGTSKATVKKEDFKADDAKHSSKLEAAADGEISTLQLELGVFSERQLQMDTTRADERYQDCELL